MQNTTKRTGSTKVAPATIKYKKYSKTDDPLQGTKVRHRSLFLNLTAAFLSTSAADMLMLIILLLSCTEDPDTAGSGDAQPCHA